MFVLIFMLLLPGDVVTNPGVVTVLKSVCSTFHQGNSSIIGDAAGSQCMGNALFSICWASMKSVNLWNTADLDYLSNRERACIAVGGI